MSSCTNKQISIFFVEKVPYLELCKKTDLLLMPTRRKGHFDCVTIDTEYVFKSVILKIIIIPHCISYTRNLIDLEYHI